MTSASIRKRHKVCPVRGDKLPRVFGLRWIGQIGARGWRRHSRESESRVGTQDFVCSQGGYGMNDNQSETGFNSKSGKLKKMFCRRRPVPYRVQVIRIRTSYPKPQDFFDGMNRRLGGPNPRERSVDLAIVCDFLQSIVYRPPQLTLGELFVAARQHSVLQWFNSRFGAPRPRLDILP